MRRLAVIVVVAATVGLDGETLADTAQQLVGWVQPSPAGLDAPLMVAQAPDVRQDVRMAEPAPAPADWRQMDDARGDAVEADTAQDLDSQALDAQALDSQALDAQALDSGGTSEPVADPAEPAKNEAPSERPVMVSVARETWIYAEPRWGARRLGYLRAGAIVGREEEPARRGSCEGGWYRVEPRGYVCLNRAASLDPDHPVAQLSSTRPFMGGLPYHYATSRYPTPPLYARLPSHEQQREVERGLVGHLAKIARLSHSPDFTAAPEPDPVPPLLAGGALLPGLSGRTHGDGTISFGHARVHSGFALLETYSYAGRQFGLTTEMALVPLDRMRIVPPSTLRGVVLSDEFTLPVGVVTSKHAAIYREHDGALAHAGPLAHRQVLSLTGASRRRGGVTYHQVRGGGFVRADQVRRIDRYRNAPKWALEGKKWIDVSILRQSLVAYEGTQPVYATLVSTGADGLADHEDSHATIQGAFLIHTKHISVTMDGDEEGDRFDLRDVPFVQYFTEGYALHGAYWHDDFGRPRSHGCVNLAPVDAAWLFRWTDPKLPKGWHAALSLQHGTVVYIHP